MPLALPRASALGNELSALTRDDRPRLDQILWSLEGDVRRDPNDLVAQAALCHALALAGDTGALRDRLQRITPHLGAVPDWLRHNLLSLLVGAGDFAATIPALETLLASASLESETIDLGTTLALRSGDLRLLARVAMLAAEDSAPRHAVQLLQAHALEPWWPAQQAALEAVLGPHTTHFTANLQTDDEYSSRIILDYYTDAPSFVALDTLQSEVDAALEQVYARHPDGLNAILDLVIVAVHGPFIPRPEPA